MQQRNGLAHHVTSHQCTVTVVVLQERNKASRNRANLLRSHVHQVNICRRHNGEVGILTTLNEVADESAIGTQRSVTLTDDVILLFLSGKINHIFVLQVNYAVNNLSIRCLDEAEVVDSGIYTERRNKTDVRTLRALDRTQTTIVCIVNVTHLEASTLTRQTARTKSRKTTLVSNLGQGVGLVHELRQRVRSEERVDDA